MLSNTKLDDPVFAIECMEGIICWLLDKIDDLIKFQKKCLPEKAKKIDSPRVYFLKIIPKPNGAANCNLFKGVRCKFNSNLQNMLQAYHGFGFINVQKMRDFSSQTNQVYSQMKAAFNYGSQSARRLRPLTKKPFQKL